MESKTEWAEILKEDNQLTRAIYNYILRTYEGAKGSKFDYKNGEFELNTFSEFLNEIISVCEHLKEQRMIDLEEASNELLKDKGIDILEYC